MLGYVQEKEAKEWIEQIRASLTASPVRYGFRLVPGLVKEDLTVHLAEIHRSHHDRAEVGLAHCDLSFVLAILKWSMTPGDSSNT